MIIDITLYLFIRYCSCDKVGIRSVSNEQEVEGEQYVTTQPPIQWLLWCVGWFGKGGGRIVAASEMLRPSVEACSASRSDAPDCKK
jgi:hypothetical protein